MMIAANQRAYVDDDKNREAIRETNQAKTINLEQRLLIGRGRDGLIFRIGSANMHKLTHNGHSTGYHWGGWVLKVPRFRLTELPQHYLKAVSQYIGSGSAESHAKHAMIANFRFEGDLQSNLWNHLCDSRYLVRIGFPEFALSPYTWQPNADESPSQMIKIQMDLNEDNFSRKINSTIPRDTCHWMPEGVMDAFHALIYHFTQPLLLQFMRDILHQLQYLDQMGVVHGDFKLSNVLLFVWDDCQYIFVLADFWDAFSIDSDGSINEMKSNEELLEYQTNHKMMAESRSEFRRLLRWKFMTEKFGTRLYKDPHILCQLRETKRKKQRFRVIRGISAGKVNLWSFGIVMGSFLCANKDSDRIKTEIKEDILYSGRTKPRMKTLSEAEAVREFQNLFNDLMRPPTSSSTPKPGKVQHPNKLLGQNDLIDSLKEAIFLYCMKEHHERGSTADVINHLDLDRREPLMDARDITEDLHNCGRCTMCLWVKQMKAATNATD